MTDRPLDGGLIDLGERLVVVAGGASGIGSATVDLLVALGARVIAIDLDHHHRPGLVGSFVVDLTDHGAVRITLTRVRAEHGVPDAAVNCVGSATVAPFGSSGPEGWSRSLQVNLLSSIHLCRETLPAMAERGSGRVVLVSSAAAQIGLTDDALYAAGKAGVEGLTRALALEYARSGVGVNCVAPGPVATPLFAAQPERTREAILRHIPVRRAGDPVELARVITFLCAPQVGFLTGQVLGVNGGLHLGH